jgi:hypothetical protein
MKKTNGVQLISYSDTERFYTSLRSAIDFFENQGSEVDVQFSTNYNGDAGLVYSAIVISKNDKNLAEEK